MISFQKIYDLYGLEHHAVEINGDVTMRTDDKQVNTEYSATQSMDSVRLSFAITLCDRMCKSPQGLRLEFYSD